MQIADWDHRRRGKRSHKFASGSQKEVTMEIPSINDAQLHTLKEMVAGTNAFSQIVPDPTKDSAKDLAAWKKGEAETQHLVDLGLIKEVTEQCKDQISRVFLQTNRLFRVFETMDIAKEMFKDTNRTVQ